MTEQAKKQRSPIETGAPDGFQYMHPTMRKNFGQWNGTIIQNLAF